MALLTKPFIFRNFLLCYLCKVKSRRYSEMPVKRTLNFKHYQSNFFALHYISKIPWKFSIIKKHLPIQNWNTGWEEGKQSCEGTTMLSTKGIYMYVFLIIFKEQHIQSGVKEAVQLRTGLRWSIVVSVVSIIFDLMSW